MTPMYYLKNKCNKISLQQVTRSTLHNKNTLIDKNIGWEYISPIKLTARVKWPLTKANENLKEI